MRRRGWLVAGLGLLVAAVLLMVYGEKPTPPPLHVEVDMPRWAKPQETKRMEQRRTLAAPSPVTQTPSTGPRRPRDPVLAALAAGGNKSAVVIEANALRYSPVGQLLIDCLAADPAHNPIDQLKERAGVDVLKDLDRIAITEHGMVLGGQFSNARWSNLFQSQPTSSPYGEQGTVYTSPASNNGGEGPLTLTTWNNQMLVLGDDPTQAQQIIDQVEGRTPPSEPVINESQTYGEIYGVLSADDLAKVLGPDQTQLANQLRSAAQRIELHVDTTKDVGIVAQIQGTDSQQADDLGKALGAALSLARLKAKAEGDDTSAGLLELAKVVPSGSHFQLEMAVPLSVIEKQLSDCKKRNESSPPHAQAQNSP